jgi:two-component system response regulator AtoC
VQKFKIFIIEDDPWYGEILAYHLSLNPDYEVERFTSAKECLERLSQKPGLVTLDYSLPDGNGMDLLRKIRLRIPDLPVIVVSGQEDVATAIQLLKEGASDYFVKNEHTAELLWNAVSRIRKQRSLEQEVEQLREELDKKYDFASLLKGASPALNKIFRLMEKASGTNINVSVTGETGTGKELVAKGIHYHSERKRGPFVAVNMAAIPRELLESELFGHEKGAFTGAAGKKTGKFEEANKGTLFLDEIAELELNLQTKLLRVLQERELVRIGSHEKISLDVRVIVATHKNLSEEVKKGHFREDLYYRIMGLPIELPPLRERGNDVLMLAKSFLEEFCRDNKLPVPVVSAGAKDKLVKYHFPGNVRELKAVMDLAVVLCDKGMIEEKDIVFASPGRDEGWIMEEKSMRAYTIQIIRYFLRKYEHNVVGVAEKLDIGKSTIYKMIQNGEISLDE